MNTTNLKTQYQNCKDTNSVPVIIVAAGSSSRMQGINKQFMPILGVPVLARTLIAFEKCEKISKIIVVTSNDNTTNVAHICKEYSINKATNIAVGGSNRHESVINGIACLDENDVKVLIHDGARPFISNAAICDVVNAMSCYDAALCVSKINDTVKMVSKDGVVKSTVDRSMLYSAQTPQGVDVKKYLTACKTLPNVQDLTDDASVMEAAGYSVKAVISSAKNIKITTPDDIAIAEAIVKGECEQ